jgi:hypothetical protein
MKTWYTWVKWGSDPAPARGPFRSIDEAASALFVFWDRHGHLASLWLESGNVALAGPFPSRVIALRADASDDTGQRMMWTEVYRLKAREDQ